MENMENNNDKLMEAFAIDDFSDCHSTDELLHSYFDRLNALSEYAGRNYAIEPTEFYEMLIDELQPVLISNNSSSSSSSLSLSSSSSSQQCHHNSLNKYRKNQSTPTNTTKSTYKALKQYLFFAGIVCILIVLVNYHTNVSRLFMRNIQTLIYPGMRYWRKLTLPIIREFPQLTNLYDESCLLSNPFFYVAELDCTPCMNVINVVDLSGYLGHFDNSIPHIIKQVHSLYLYNDHHSFVLLFGLFCFLTPYYCYQLGSVDCLLFILFTSSIVLFVPSVASFHSGERMQ